MADITIKTLLDHYFKKKDGEHSGRKVGRYYCSEIFAIEIGWKTPQDFFEKPKFPLLSKKRIFTGTVMEEAFDLLLRSYAEDNDVKYEHEPKKYFFIDLETSEERWMDVELIPDDITKEERIKIFSKYAPKENEIRLTVKPDFVFPKRIIETKFIFTEMGDKYKYQLEAEHRAFERDVYTGVLSSPFDIKLIKYEPSQERWDRAIKIIKDYHKKVKEISKNNE